MNIFRNKDNLFVIYLNQQTYRIEWQFQEHNSDYNADDDLRLLYSEQHQVILILRKEFTTHTIAIYAIKQESLICQLQQQNNSLICVIDLNNPQYEFQMSIRSSIISFFEQSDQVYVLFSTELYKFNYPQFLSNNICHPTKNSHYIFFKELNTNRRQKSLIYHKSKIATGQDFKNKIIYFQKTGRVQNRKLILNKVKIIEQQSNEQIRKEKTIQLPIKFEYCPKFNDQEVGQYQILYLKTEKQREITMKVMLILRNNYSVLEFYGSKLSKLENMCSYKDLGSNISLLEPVYLGRKNEILAYSGEGQMEIQYISINQLNN